MQLFLIRADDGFIINFARNTFSYLTKHRVSINYYAKITLCSNSLRSIENNRIYFLHNRVWVRNKGHTICS